MAKDKVLLYSILEEANSPSIGPSHENNKDETQ
jgi:hypothetical protein